MATGKKRKSSLIQEEIEVISEKGRELLKMLEASQKEEADKIQKATEAINDIEKEFDVFCGIVLTTQDLLAIIQLAIDTKENVRIPFRLYYNE